MYKDKSCDRTTQYHKQFYQNHLSYVMSGVPERFAYKSHTRKTRYAHDVNCSLSSNKLQDLPCLSTPSGSRELCAFEVAA